MCDKCEPRAVRQLVHNVDREAKARRQPLRTAAPAAKTGDILRALNQAFAKQR